MKCRIFKKLKKQRKIHETLISLRKAWKIKRNSTEKKESSKQKSTVL